MIYYSTTTLGILQISLFFSTIGSDKSCGTNTLAPDRRAFTTFFDFFRRIYETNMRFFNSSN